MLSRLADPYKDAEFAASELSCLGSRTGSSTSKSRGPARRASGIIPVCPRGRNVDTQSSAQATSVTRRLTSFERTRSAVVARFAARRLWRAAQLMSR